MSYPVLTDIVSIKFPYKRKPLFRTLQNTFESSAIQTIALRSFPLYKFEFKVSSAAENIERFNNFYNAMLGGCYPFLFKDFYDNKATGQSLGIGDGSQTEFQLKKRYEYPYNSTQTADYALDKKHIKEASVTVKVGDITVENYTVNYETGIITFSEPPTGTITADFEFFYKVRFDEESTYLERDWHLNAEGDVVLIECV
ncbi:MAG TPA: DUF2460 domain-containing protein [bacterium]|nr:DUF2460 domain-containing protein [bacterium]HPN32360.1 DUF2460 domain-containing protein [bacterium]